jgi:hypothetical protein
MTQVQHRTEIACGTLAIDLCKPSGELPKGVLVEPKPMAGTSKNLSAKNKTG